MIKSRAIVLHRFAYSDSSWIVKALTEECGIVSFIVKGGKRKESPFKGALDPLATSEVVFRQNPNAELQFIKEATILDWHKNLRDDLLNLAEAQVMTEIVLRYAPQGVPLPEEFALLERAIDEYCYTPAAQQTTSQTATTAQHAALITAPQNAPQTAPQNAPQNTPQNAPRSSIFARWLLDICDLWGYHLELSVCSRCEHLLEEAPADFHPETGELICQHCLGVATARARKETTDDLWNLLNAKELTNKQFVENALLAYLRHHIGFLKEIKSLQFLNQTRNLFMK